jgi:pyruvate/2-oxoglutarate dehydrogenase complex dihydrolipoamide acyltransferase (E2) component
MPNIELQHKRDLPTFRRIAIGTWKTAFDPSVYGTIELRMDRALEYIEDFRRATGKRLTITHMMARAVAEAMRAEPDANAVLRFNRIYLRKRVGVFMQVAMTDDGAGKVDLSGVTVYEPQEKSLEELVDEVEQKVASVRQRKDPALEKTRGMFRWIPSLMLNRFLGILSFLSSSLNLDLRRFGVPSDPFGSVMITNVGSLGLDIAYAPLVPFTRVPIVLAVGAVRRRAVVDGDHLAIGSVMNVNATFDHRFIDGVHASTMSRVLKAWLEDPYAHFDRIVERPSSGSEASDVPVLGDTELPTRGTPAVRNSPAELGT